MSKWELLKSTLKKGQRDSTNQASIHSFQGFQKLKKVKCLWSGFELAITCSSSTKSWVDIIQACEEYFLLIDCTECKLCLSIDQFNEISSTEFKSLIGSFVAGRDDKGNYTIEGFPSICLSLSSEKDFESMKEFSQFGTSFMNQASFLVRHLNMNPIHKVMEFYRYELHLFKRYDENDPNYNEITLYTREPPKNKRISSQDLLSNQLYGVDNTGNICVWPSEPLMLYLFCKCPFLVDMVRGKRVLEVGGGMTGLVGLGLAALEISSEVVISDGHPHCVTNQRACIEMCKSKGAIHNAFPITSQLLEWSSVPMNISKWDVIIGVDCLFFRDYHDALITFLLRILQFNGVCIFFQPKRSGTMQLFIDKASHHFIVEIIENYLEEITQEDIMYKSSDSSYDHDIHFPYFVVLRRKD